MKKLLLFLFTITSIQFSAQEDAWVFLKDKPNKNSFLDNPLSMLSQRAIDRRSKLNIAIDEKDVPIEITYYNQLKNESRINVLAKSKWLNAIHVQGELADLNNLLTKFNFIDRLEFANKSLNKKTKKNIKKIAPNHFNKLQNITSKFNYGAADNQIKMLKGNFLHEQGLTGEGQVIAIIDAGFPNVNTLSAFKKIRDNNQILGGYNFADRNTDYYSRSSHGTHVLSSIAGYIEDEYVGTAPDAKFYLFITEISESETVLEESLWVEATERADSLGVDVINTSLGYTTYDNPNHSHSYADLDGKTTFISRGAEIGASRGLLLVNAAGNSGNKEWKYIGAPADAPSVITVGAVKSTEEIASFSSFGPSADGRIKPEILGQGQNPALIDYNTGLVKTTSSGTSFSAPIMAGLIACLNGNEGFLIKSSSQKSSENLNTLLKKTIYESANMFNNPSDQHGYGIPDFEVALNNYIAVFSIDGNEFETLQIFPNPTENELFISVNDDGLQDLVVKVFNLQSKKVFEKTISSAKNIDISFLNKGMYIIKISNKNQQKTLKLIKR